MPELTARNIALMALMAATIAAVLAAVALIARQDDNAPILLIAPGSQQTAPAAAANLLQAQIQDELIDLNLASTELLETLPGIGPVLAEAIVYYRENVRPFRSIEEVQEVPKIGPVTYRNIRDLVTVSGPQ